MKTLEREKQIAIAFLNWYEHSTFYIDRPLFEQFMTTEEYLSIPSATSILVEQKQPDVIQKICDRCGCNPIIIYLTEKGSHCRNCWEISQKT